jgi:RNA polymerase sigma-70 factor (ECF subfamily)
MSAQHRKKTESLASFVVGQYGRELQRYFLRCLRHPQNARDLEQEVYLRLLRVEDAQQIHSPKSYVYRIAAHVIFEFRERARREQVVFDSDVVSDAAQSAANPDPAADEQVSSEQQLETLLALLPPMTRAILLLKKREGLSREEIAEKLGISPHTVKKHLLSAMVILRKAQWEIE